MKAYFCYSDLKVLYPVWVSSCPIGVSLHPIVVLGLHAQIGNTFDVIHPKLLPNLCRGLQGSGTFCITQNTKHKPPQIYNKLTRFNDNDGRKLPLKYYLLVCWSFWEISKTIFQNIFRLKWKINGTDLRAFLKTFFCNFLLFPPKTWRPLKLKLLQVNIFIPS